MALESGFARAHRPVLAEEAVAGLAPRPDGIYVDGTYGRGGHAALLLATLSEQGRLILIDQDPEAIAHAREHHGGDPRVSIHHTSFAALPLVVDQEGVAGRVDGVLLDLGVSSPQLDDPERGFSFSRSGPLDMRMNPEAGQSAADWLAEAEEGEIIRVLREYGEERFARRIARAILQARAAERIESTGRLAEIIAEAVPAGPPGRHPATRSFQAIRIHVNRELAVLDQVLASLRQVLAPGGRAALISFHSLEDRRVKRFIRGNADQPKVVAGVPLPDAELPPFRAVGKAIKAGEAEQAENPRARSAVLRIAERRS
ncbi:16S rRNA (cytosine(1402)-N(4))-methyltransferase RsmH [Natronospira bacteriovora]|uniref:Ribosomal RNA small subunit methyltransferase H n=1 Tax=Natronospira bacteriovora TaxID=3069753 RepID=A0ABU0W675_9GAMM|nr:16S rRNA (cytosine(1402)-N(4))-methyltransferase RsmH [Natronospira sp. AB-CW4]MDQ2069514.1 16S rRNA (cytosine(1402)-N(4))-methyltransferase RsmH [Natronospira sp. AB-CW4]